MKNVFLFIFLFLILIGAYAQNIQVLDKATLIPVKGATIISKNASFITTTDSKGKANVLSFSGPDSITIKHLNYQPVTVSLTELNAKGGIIFLVESPYSLNEVVVSANKSQQSRQDIPQQVKVVKSNELNFMNQQTTAEVLQQSGHVLVQKSQLGGGSPIIRGFEANKVLLVVDGVRMNNAIFRGGHLQNVITLDNTMLEKAEIVFGPGSVVYGSDALGGVIHFMTKQPLFADSTEKVSLKANAFTRYSTAYNEKTGHVDFNLASRKLAYLGGFTYSDFDNLKTGSKSDHGGWGKRDYFSQRINGKDSMVLNEDSKIQKPSGYQQYDLIQKVLFKHNRHIRHLLNFQYSTSSDIPRYDRLTEKDAKGILKNAEWYYGPQKRLLATYNLLLRADKGLYSTGQVIIGYQDIEESRHNRSFNKATLSHRVEHVKVWTLNADFSKKFLAHELRYGVEGTYNKVNSKATAENITTQVITPTDTRYPDGGSEMQTLAGYITHSWNINSKLILSDGIRLSSIKLDANFKDKSFFPFPYDNITQQSTAFNGNLGLVYKPGMDWKFSILGSTGFRAPNVDDLSKVFESVSGNLIVPNPGLKPEHVYNGEIGVSKLFFDRLLIEGVGFYNLYQDIITTQKFKYNGADSIMYAGKLSRVTANVNAKKGYIYGLSASLNLKISHVFSVNSTLNYTYGRIKTDSADYPLDHITPLFGKTGINASLKKLRGEFFIIYQGAKKIKDYNLVGEDNILYATASGTPAWYTLNIRTAYQINNYLQVQLALENILDHHYRVFASGISGAGRNFVLTLRGRL